MYFKNFYILIINFKNVVIYKLIIIELSFARCFESFAIIIIQHIVYLLIINKRMHNFMRFSCIVLYLFDIYY